MKLEGIHHITAITSDAPGNVEFYAGVLGLRLVKKSVNQDDPTVYHLFYGDEEGSPGADLTFFEYPGAARGRAGAGMVHRIVWRVASGGALDFWHERVQADGRWEVRGDQRGSFYAYDAPPAGAEAFQGAGTVHHVAFASQPQEQDEWRSRVAAAGARPTEVIDRFYFRSVYFREPSGVLFEIATIGPGFAVDEDEAHLGERLSLPPRFEPLRERLEGTLTPLPNPRLALVALAAR